MQAEKTNTAYELFVGAHADYIGETPQKVEGEISPEQFETQLRDLHRQYMDGEFSFGRFTEMIGVPHWELWEILDLLGLSLHN